MVLRRQSGRASAPDGQTCRDLPRPRAPIQVQSRKRPPASFTHQFRHNCGVISSARTDVNRTFALLRRKCLQAEGMQARLAIIQSFGSAECDQHILIKIRWIVRAALDLPFRSNDRPRGAVLQISPWERSRMPP